MGSSGFSILHLKGAGNKGNTLYTCSHKTVSNDDDDLNPTVELLDKIVAQGEYPIHMWS